VAIESVTVVSVNSFDACLDEPLPRRNFEAPLLSSTDDLSFTSVRTDESALSDPGSGRRPLSDLFFNATQTSQTYELPIFVEKIKENSAVHTFTWSRTRELISLRNHSNLGKTANQYLWNHNSPKKRQLSSLDCGEPRQIRSSGQKPNLCYARNPCHSSPWPSDEKLRNLQGLGRRQEVP
jgi:hypothetical protein